MNSSALPVAVAEALLANPHAGIAVYAGDTGECLLANGTMAEIAGGSVNTMRLQNFRDFDSWREAGLDVEAESTLRDGLLRHHEVTLQTSFGKTISIDCSISRLDIEGRPHLMIVAFDITERRLAEQALSVREQELRTLVDTVPDLIVRYDRELRRTYVNPAWEKASGLSAREVIEVPAAAIPKVPNPAHPEYVRKVRLVLETGTPQEIGFTWVNAFGTELYLEYVIVPEHDRHGEITGVLAVGRDLSERRRAEETLHRQTAELEEEVAQRQMAQENLQENALLLEEEIEKRQKAQGELERLNAELEQRVNERTAELEEKNAELYRMNRLFVGRELRMVELKERVRELESHTKIDAGS